MSKTTNQQPTPRTPDRQEYRALADADPEEFTKLVCQWLPSESTVNVLVRKERGIEEVEVTHDREEKRSICTMCQQQVVLVDLVFLGNSVANRMFYNSGGFVAEALLVGCPECDRETVWYRKQSRKWLNKKQDYDSLVEYVTAQYVKGKMSDRALEYSLETALADAEKYPIDYY